MPQDETGRTGDEFRDFPLRVGVALGAGSAASIAEIGALQVFAEAGIPIHCVAGTSAGAIVGAAFAAGQLKELGASLASLSRGGVLRLFDLVWPREGLLSGRRGLEFVAEHLGERIEELALPFAAVATDLRTGGEVVMTRGPVFDAVRASIALPGIFTPWRIGGRLLVDGGLVNPIPVSAARALGAEFVIALNVLPLSDENETRATLSQHLSLIHASPAGDAGETPDHEVDETLGLLEVVSQASTIMESQVAKGRLREDPPGWLLQIPVPAVGIFDVHRAEELVEIGRQSAKEALPELRAALEAAVPLLQRLLDLPRKAAALLPSTATD